MLVKDYVPRAMATLAVSSRRGWSTYAREIQTRWGDQELGDVLTTDVAAAAREIQDNAMQRATSMSGVGARAGFIHCARAIWGRAVDDGLCTRNPAAGVTLPRKGKPRNRRALTNDELTRVQFALAATNDPDLALLVFRVFLETGARRNELLGLHTKSLHKSERGWTLTLREGAKLDSVRSMPITERLADGLQELAAKRIGQDWQDEQVPLLRNKRGQAITHRWLETKSKHVRTTEPDLGSPSELYFTWHLLRHTAGTLVERVAGFATAAFFLGHAPSGGSATSVTLTYTQPSMSELRMALEAIWEPEKAEARRVHENRQTVVRAWLDSEPDNDQFRIPE